MIYRVQNHLMFKIDKNWYLPLKDGLINFGEVNPWKAEEVKSLEFRDDVDKRDYALYLEYLKDSIFNSINLEEK